MDPALKHIHRQHARELWSVLSKKTKTCIKFGVVPAAVLLNELAAGYDPTYLAVALMEMADGAR